MLLTWLLGACSAYDPQLLPTEANHPVVGDGGVGAPRDAEPADTGAKPADAGGNSECETNFEFPSCTRPNAETICIGAKCILVNCIHPYADCNHDPDDGCEARIDSVAHCGLCGAACQYQNGIAGCDGSSCSLLGCEAGWDDCDAKPQNGCETPLDGPANCGACENACAARPQATAGCHEGTCGVGACLGAFGDCNGLPDDGCEQPLDTNEHCGGCHTACAPAHAVGSCATFTCAVDGCETDYVDCNGLPADGCEARLDTPAHCGQCGRSCSLPNVTRHLCELDVCLVDHGCEPGDVACQDGASTNGCTSGYADCNGDPEDGCETDLARLSDCGACGNSCVQDGAVTACVEGSCTVVGCTAGYDRCTAQGSCQSLAMDPAHCGACNAPCTSDKPNCAGGKCTSQACAAGYADCDGLAGNGCEVALSSLSNCGACGQSCGPLPHATASCSSGLCRIGSCDTGFADCDGDVSNGCEIDLRTVSDCGACAKSCSPAFAVGTCTTGACQVQSCLPGRGNCNGLASDGCEVDLTLPESCGGCGTDCRALPFVLSSGCGPSGCQYVCQAGRADCDQQVQNGCEADLTNVKTCGSCGNDCTSLPRVSSASCQGGVCKNLVCESGWADCNGNPTDGCERSLRTLQDCGACNQPCAPAHAAGSCLTGTCQITACDNGFANCNGNAADGCEAALSSPNTCGSCTNKCPSGTQCQNGQCTCNQNSDCSGGLSCCSGKCTDTGGICFPWPCIPGTARTNNANCGGCGQVCALFCCSG